MRRILVVALISASALGLAGVSAPPASSLSGIAGSCEFTTLSMTRDAEKNVWIDGGSTLCVISGFGLVNIPRDSANTGSITIWGTPHRIQCDGSSRVAAVSALVNVTVRSNSGLVRNFYDLNLVLEAAAATQNPNVTTSLLVKGTQFAGVGAFSRGSSSCTAETASWTLGSLTFEDPEV